MRKIYMLFLVVICSWSCKSFEWKQDRYQAGNNPLLFNEGELVGTGLKQVRSGFRPKYCLKNVKAGLSGGTMQVRFQRAEDFNSENDPRLKFFIEESLKRMKQYNIFKYRVMPLVMVISISDREATLDERKLLFRSDIKKLLKKGSVSEFYDKCGTEFIESVTFHSKIYFFFCLYLPAEKEKEISAKMKKYLTGIPGDIFQLSVFRGLSYEYPLYYSFMSNAGEVYVPEDFFYGDNKKRNLESFLTGAVQAAISSSHGSLKRYKLRPWLSLPETAELGYRKNKVRPGEASPENIYNSILQLRESLSDYRILLQVKNEKKSGVGLCRKELERERNILLWVNLKKCERQAWTRRETDFSLLPACQSLIRSIGRINRISRCSGNTRDAYVRHYARVKKVFHLLFFPQILWQKHLLSTTATLELISLIKINIKNFLRKLFRDSQW